MHRSRSPAILQVAAIPQRRCANTAILPAATPRAQRPSLTNSGATSAHRANQSGLILTEFGPKSPIAAQIEPESVRRDRARPACPNLSRNRPTLPQAWAESIEFGGIRPSLAQRRFSVGSCQPESTNFGASSADIGQVWPGMGQIWADLDRLGTATSRVAFVRWGLPVPDPSPSSRTWVGSATLVERVLQRLRLVFELAVDRHGCANMFGGGVGGASKEGNDV